MQRMPMPRGHNGDRTDRWLRFVRDGGMALVGVAALAGLGRDLSATRGPVVAWIIVTLLGGAAGLFAWSLIEVRDAGYGSRSGSAPRGARAAERAFPAGDVDPREVVPLVPLGLFPLAPRRSAASRRTYRAGIPGPRAQSTSRTVRMRTRRTPSACAAAQPRRPTTRATRRGPHTTA